MLKHLSSGGVLLLALLSAGVHAADRTQGGLVINKVIPEGTGILISFTVKPTDCVTSYKGGYAYLSNGVKDYDSLYLIAATVQATGSPVTIHYADNGDCSSVGQLLALSNIVVN